MSTEMHFGLYKQPGKPPFCLHQGYFQCTDIPIDCGIRLFFSIHLQHWTPAERKCPELIFMQQGHSAVHEITGR